MDDSLVEFSAPVSSHACSSQSTPCNEEDYNLHKNLIPIV